MELGIRSQIVLFRLAAAAAMLTCFAIVLDVGGLSTAGGRPATPDREQVAPLPPPEPVVRLEPDDAGGPQPLAPAMELAVFRVFEAQTSSPQIAAGSVPAPNAQSPGIVGIWAPDMNSCSLRDFRQGLLPTIINTDGAWAGGTFCTFTNQKPAETGWRVVATCTNEDEHWTTPVRLTVKGDRLTWTSKRGTQVYRRCAPDFRMAGGQ
jgi:hypothetical protein